MSAQSVNKLLDAKEQSMVTIAAFTANGDLDKLKPALHSGLDAGLTINEIKEVLVQLYAYCGFPRSLNGINTFMAVVDERIAKGVKDQAGAEGTRVEEWR
jgi:4-carboxymuconolactone decarboxylase